MSWTQIYVALTHHQRSFLLQQVESTIESHNKSNWRDQLDFWVPSSNNVSTAQPYTYGCLGNRKDLKSQMIRILFKRLCALLGQGSHTSKISTIW